MSKIKMRCIACGKWFQSANAKEVTCPDCVQKARKEKLAAKNAPPTPTKTTGPGVAPTRSVPPPKPKPTANSGSHWLDTLSDIKVGEPDQPVHPKLPSSPAPRDNRTGPERFDTRGGGPGNYRDRDERGPRPNRYPDSPYEDRGPGGYRENTNRGPGAYRENDYRGPGAYKGGISGGLGQRPRQPMEGNFGRGPRPAGPSEPFKRGGKPADKPKAARPAAPPKPKREKIPPPAPFVPTPEQIVQVEARYRELAHPAEYDGIRTQVAKELSIPKKAVKQIIKDFREREHIPSWWETQAYKGNTEELEKIKAAYEPYLPVPPVGVHKKISDELSLKPGDVYQAIKQIRLDLHLPQYNDPVLHGLEPSRKEQPKAETPTSESSEPAKSEATEISVEEVTETPAPAVEEAAPPAEAQEAVIATAPAEAHEAVVATSTADERAGEAQ